MKPNGTVLPSEIFGLLPDKPIWFVDSSGVAETFNRLMKLRAIYFDGLPISRDASVYLRPRSIFSIGEHEWQFLDNKWYQTSKLNLYEEYCHFLEDDTAAHRSQLRCKIRCSPHSISIGAEGYGEKTANDSEAFPVLIEYQDNQLRVIVWSDINNEEPTHVITMERAKEVYRQTE